MCTVVCDRTMQVVYKRKDSNRTTMRSIYFLALCLLVVGQSEQCDRLPDDCFHPNGTDCQWYERCLNRRVPCGIAAPNYVVSGFQLCQFRVNPYAMVSSESSERIQALSKCIQTSLFQLLHDKYASECYMINHR